MQSKKTTFLASFGSGLEYYDFVTFALLAPYLNTLFFPNDHHMIGLIKVFCLFAIGYLARPFGGLFFGMIGDMLGRRKVFLWVIALMALSTLAIGLLPTYVLIGSAAPLLLLIFRLLQGLSFGAELPGSLVFLAEHAKAQKRGAMCGILIGTVSIGNSLAGLIVTMLSRYVTHDFMLIIGWRIPFIVGGLLAIISYYLRKDLHETPVFRAASQGAHKTPLPLVTLIKTHKKQMALGISLLVFSASTIIIGLSLPAQLHVLYHYPLHSLYLATTIGSLISIVAIPFLGAVSDHVGRKKLFMMVSILSIFSIGFLFQLPKGQTLWDMWLFIVGYQSIIALLASCYFTLLAEIFPTRVRFTGYALCYNLVYAVAGFLPAMATYFIHQFNSTTPLVMTFIGLGLLSLFGIYFIEDKTGQTLKASTMG